MKNKLEEIFEKTTQQEKREVEILQNALSATIEGYSQDPTAANKRNWDAARMGLDKAIERLWHKYFHQKPAFPHLHAAVKYLQKEGYSVNGKDVVKKSKVYSDKDKGLIRVRPDNRIFEAEVKAYAATYLKKIEDRTQDLSALHKKKSIKEIDKIHLQAEKIAFELEVAKGKYVRKSEAEVDSAMKLAALVAEHKNFVNRRAIEWIYRTGGDPKKVQTIIDDFNTASDEICNELANLNEIHLVIKHTHVN